MARVRAFDLPGLACWFCSNDHEPPHFHVKRDGEWEYRVFFLLDRREMLETVFAHRPMPPAHRKAIWSAVEGHRAALLEEWLAVRGDATDESA